MAACFLLLFIDYSFSGGAMLFLRSFLFNGLFYISLMLQMIFWAPFFFLLPRRIAWKSVKFSAFFSLWLHDLIIGTQREISGIEYFPEGSFIIAAKHQSFWDVLLLTSVLSDPLFILKKQLLKIPVFGFFLMKMRHIAIERDKKTAIFKIFRVAAKELAQVSRQLVIYPEGTRRTPGDVPVYKSGIAELYSRFSLPVVPVAHQAGLFWSRRRFVHFPGIIRVRFLPPIEPGLSKEDFMKRLTDTIESVNDTILVETSLDPIRPDFPRKAQERLAVTRLNKDPQMPSGH